ncbi:MAG TPA: hypothetical protein VK911_02675, partial [Vicinamibacterales bacterium]|nr:hypothetical protein [Vicinamibacterales bacterium]
ARRRRVDRPSPGAPTTSNDLMLARFRRTTDASRSRRVSPFEARTTLLRLRRQRPGRDPRPMDP